MFSQKIYEQFLEISEMILFHDEKALCKQDGKTICLRQKYIFFASEFYSFSFTLIFLVNLLCSSQQILTFPFTLYVLVNKLTKIMTTIKNFFTCP